ncbi:Hypothetical predicted protein [Mytilus galloprovincialis]|uniref:Uncharacterized protein n=1 Tax=Mytilus galloprovincialis TaxID=29158 RepID=A0A8B6FTS7_MYTGA|nr:Hypothetical predicted protein [Mytilus galloprovincialis]
MKITLSCRAQFIIVGDIPISKCMKLESMNEFENLVIASSYLKNEQGCSSILNEKSFLQAVDKSQDLLCRLMLSYFGYSEQNVVYLAKALRFAIEKRHDTISMGIAWHLTWIYYKQNQSAFPSLVDIWPAVRCSCTNESEYKNDICSSEAVIVVQLDTDAAQPSVMFFSIEVIYFTNLMYETLPFANRIIPYSDHIPITGSSAEMLFDSHRNLTLICKSSRLTSKEPCRPSNTQFEITACVKLYCKAKGFIPIGEEHFPKIFCGMRTTVVQGTPTLMTGMQIGKKVGTDNFKKGTLGGFVRFRGENAFLTCLHVFLTAEELTADYITLDDTESYHVKYYQNTTEASNKDDGIVCGKIQVFGFGKNSEGTSIDAALIQLEKGIPIDSSHFTATTGQNIFY